jgi:hypothetical protein
MCPAFLREELPAQPFLGDSLPVLKKRLDFGSHVSQPERMIRRGIILQMRTARDGQIEEIPVGGKEGFHGSEAPVAAETGDAKSLRIHIPEIKNPPIRFCLFENLRKKPTPSTNR